MGRRLLQHGRTAALVPLAIAGVAVLLAPFAYLSRLVVEGLVADETAAGGAAVFILAAALLSGAAAILVQWRRLHRHFSSASGPHAD